MCNRDVDVNPDRQTHRRLEAFEMWISKWTSPLPTSLQDRQGGRHRQRLTKTCSTAEATVDKPHALGQIHTRINNLLVTAHKLLRIHNINTI